MPDNTPDSTTLDVLAACIAFGSGQGTAWNIAKRFGVSRLNEFAYYLIQSEESHSLGRDELASLVKAFVLMGNKIGFCRGSTPVVHILLRVLSQVDNKQATELTEWAYTIAKNPYVPFGTRRRHVARTAAEYMEVVAKRAARQAELVRLQQAEAQERRRTRGRCHEERITRQKAASAERRIFVDNLAQLPLGEALVAIAHATQRPTYFPESFANITEAVIESIPMDTRRILLLKLDKKRKGSWGALRRVLERTAKSRCTDTTTANDGVMDSRGTADDRS